MAPALSTFRRHPRVRLRPAAEGGAAFLPDSATTLELDAGAFAALAFLDAPQTARGLRRRLVSYFGRNFTLGEIDLLLRELAAVGFVTTSTDETCGSMERTGSESDRAPHPPAPRVPAIPPPSHTPTLSHSHAPPPESVHLQLNNVCNLRCPSCYVGLQREDVGSLPLERLFELIDEWAAMGVFQLALGGGEPLMSPKFAPVVRRARERGIVPNVTTNGWLITPELLDEIAGSIGEVRLSLNDVVSANVPLLEERAALLRERGVRFGFNLIVTRPNRARLAEWLRWSVAQGAATVNLIRPKPAPGNDAWYARNALSPAEMLQVAGELRTLEPLFEESALTVDCAFSFLFYGQPAAELRARGVAGCAMGDRFAVVAWNGDVYPCSHLRGDEFRAGSVRSESFRAIWERSAALVRLRDGLGRVEGACGSCVHNPGCKGCRAVVQQQAGHWLMADRDCPVSGHPEEALAVLPQVG